MDFSEFLDQGNSKKRYEERLRSLRSNSFDTTNIESGTNAVIAKLQEGAKSLVVYGEPQSGKTEFMIALTCALLDQGRKTIFVVMNDNTTLEIQNFRRFKDAPEINPTPLRHLEFIDQRDEDKKTDRPRVIFYRKNSRTRETDCRVQVLEDRVVIDDEADYASPNSKINKKEQSAINLKVGELGKIGQGGKYIGVTATPGRLDLNNTFANDTKDWVFLNSHDRYLGRQYFFPVSKTDTERSDFILVKQPEEGEAPQQLEQSFLRFVTKVAVRNLSLDKTRTKYSMLIHTDGKKEVHRRDKADIEKYISQLESGSDKREQNIFNSSLITSLSLRPASGMGYRQRTR